MKRCDYCSKEISYFEQYCCDNCEQQAKNFYEKENKCKNLFGVINIVSVFLALGGCITCAFYAPAGCLILFLVLLILGLTIFFIPLPTLDAIKKYKIKKAVKQTRILGIVIIAFSLIIFTAAVYYFVI